MSQGQRPRFSNSWIDLIKALDLRKGELVLDGNSLIMTSLDPSSVRYYIGDDTSNAFRIIYTKSNKSAEFRNLKAAIYMRAKDAIVMQPNDDTSDYIMFKTEANVPKIQFIGGDGKVENVVDPTNPQDVATKKYVDDTLSGKILDSGVVVGTVMTRNGLYNDVDSSGLFSSAKHMLFVEIYTLDNAAGQSVAVRPKGGTQAQTHLHDVANQDMFSTVVVFTDSDCVWQYIAPAALTAATYKVIGGLLA